MNENSKKYWKSVVKVWNSVVNKHEIKKKIENAIKKIFYDMKRKHKLIKKKWKTLNK